jgi:hypothetical protein
VSLRGDELQKVERDVFSAARRWRLPWKRFLKPDVNGQSMKAQMR